MKTFWNLLWRSLVVAIVYTAASAVIGGLVMQGVDSTQTPRTNPALLLATTFITGFVLGVVLGPVTSLVHAGRVRTIGIWTMLIFLNMSSVIIEGYFFAPGLLPLVLVPRFFILQALSSVIVAGAIVLLFPTSTIAPGRSLAPKRPLFSWLGRFVGSAAAYLLFYYFFGAINYALVTGPYYETHSGLTVPAADTVIAVEAVRSVIIILSILPLITTLSLPKRRLTTLCGFLLFMIGGVLPLLMQTGALPPVLLVASGVEIFFQNFITGVVAALLLGRFQTPPASSTALPVEVLEHQA
jgi:hypothetical protein